jgi:hypothetical protein
MSGPTPSRRGWCAACKQVGDLLLVRTKPHLRARCWRCVPCVERSRAFKAARDKANGINDL